MKRGILLIVFFGMIFFGFSSVSAIQYSGCSDPSLDWSGQGYSGCQEVTSCVSSMNANTYYLLTQDLTLQRGANCFYISGSSGHHNIALDLNEYTVTYDTWPVVEVPNPSFEEGLACGAGSCSGTPGWSFSNAPNAYVSGIGTFYKLGGNNSLVFPGGASPQYVETTSSIFLPAGITYEVHVLSKDATPSGLYVDIPQLTAECDGATVTTGITSGMWDYYLCSFTPSSDTTATVRVGFSSSPSADTSLDMIEIRPRRAGAVFNVGGGVSDPNQNIVLKNGNLIQGAAKSFGSDGGSFMVSLLDTIDAEIYDVTVNTSGNQMLAVGVTRSDNLRIHDGQFHSKGTHALLRDQLLSTLTFNYWSDGSGTSNSYNTMIYNNILGTFQSGIKITGENTTIFNNTILMKSYISNSYGITLRNPNQGVKFYNNTIIGNGRGIHLTPGEGAKIYDNYIDLVEERNPEYPNPFLSDTILDGSCAQGIKLESGSTGAHNAHIYNNYVRMSQPDSYYGFYVGCSFNINQGTGFVSDSIIEDNIFVSESFNHDGIIAAPVAGFFLEMDNVQNFTVRNNHFLSDSRGVIYVNNVHGMLFDSNTFESNNPLAVENYFVHNTHAGSSNRFSDTTFLNSTMIGVALDTPYGGGTGSWNYFVDWYLNVTVKDNGLPLTGANLVIQDSTPQTVFSQASMQTDSVSLDLNEYEIIGSGFSYTQTPSESYTVIVTHPITSEVISVPVTLDQSQTIYVDFYTSSNSPDVDSSGGVNVVDLAIVVFNYGRPVDGSGYDHLDIDGDSDIDFSDAQVVANLI